MKSPTKEKHMVIVVEEKHQGTRIDVFLAKKLSESRSQIQNLIEESNVTIQGKKVAKNYKISKGDKIEVVLPPEEDLTLEAEDIPIDILYEDDCFLVVNKPSGMVVHPGAGNKSGTLVNALLNHCGIDNLSTIGGEDRPGIVHRIDKKTSGTLVVAKTNQAYTNLVNQTKDRSMLRYYEGVVYGRMKEDSGIIDVPIGRHSVKRTTMAPDPSGRINSKKAISEYKVIKDFNQATYLSVKLHTGRTHQIRVHLTHLGYPVAGDPVYGARIGGKVRQKLENGLRGYGQCLHARKLGFKHPLTNKYMEFISPLPDEFKNYLEKLENLQKE